MSISRKETREEKRKAFEAVVSGYESYLLRYVSHLIRDVNAAQDVVQETFIRLYERWHEEMERSAKLSSWLYRVAHNCAVDHIRKESRRHLLHERQSKEEEHSIIAERHVAGEISEEAERAVKALGKLSLKEQQLVILKVYEEMSYREISEIAGLSVSNVGYILHFAMKKMADELKKAEML